MFKIQVTKLDTTVENIYNMNQNTDDFLQFIPKQFGVQPSAMEIFVMPDAWKFELEAYLKIDGNMLNVAESGKLIIFKIESTFNEVTEIEEEEMVVVKEYVGTLIEYPYDSKGKFIVSKQAVV